MVTRYALLLSLVSAVGCPGSPDNEVKAGLPNPASVHCEEKGGTLEIETGPNGQYGLCRFPDGSHCEEWAFFRGQCKRGERFEASGQ